MEKDCSDFSLPKVPGFKFSEEATLGGSRGGKLRVYELPKKEVLYVIGVDVAEGKIRTTKHSLAEQLLQGKHTPDFSTICVLNCHTLNQVAAYSSLEQTDEFTKKLYAVGQIYKNHIMAIEANGPGIAVINGMALKGERRFYNRRVFDKTNRTFTPMKGFKTTSSSRELIINQFRISLQEEDGVVLNDKETIQECLTFKYNNQGKAEAAAGCYDDQVFAAMIALEARRAFYRPKISGEVKYAALPAYERNIFTKLDQIDEQTSQNHVDTLDSLFSPGADSDVNDNFLG